MAALSNRPPSLNEMTADILSFNAEPTPAQQAPNLDAMTQDIMSFQPPAQPEPPGIIGALVGSIKNSKLVQDLMDLGSTPAEGYNPQTAYAEPEVIPQSVKEQQTVDLQNRQQFAKEMENASGPAKFAASFGGMLPAGAGTAVLQAAGVPAPVGFGLMGAQEANVEGATSGDLVKAFVENALIAKALPGAKAIGKKVLGKYVGGAVGMSAVFDAAQAMTGQNPNYVQNLALVLGYEAPAKLVKIAKLAKPSRTAVADAIGVPREKLDLTADQRVALVQEAQRIAAQTPLEPTPTGEPVNAEGTRATVEAPSGQEGIPGPESGRIRVRDTEENRVGAEYPEEPPGPSPEVAPVTPQETPPVAPPPRVSRGRVPISRPSPEAAVDVQPIPTQSQVTEQPSPPPRFGTIEFTNPDGSPVAANTEAQPITGATIEEPARTGPVPEPVGSLPPTKGQAPTPAGTENVPPVEQNVPQQPEVTSIKNAFTDAERAARDAEPLPPAERRGWEESLRLAQEEEKANPARPSEIIEAANSGAETKLNDVDYAVLLREKVRVRNAQKAASDRLADPNLSEEQKTVAQNEWDAAETRLDQIDKAAKATGTVSGRGLASRKMVLAQDFSLEKLAEDARAAKRRPLTRDEYAELEAKAKRIQDLETKYEELQKSKGEPTESDIAAEIDAIIKEESGQRTPGEILTEGAEKAVGAVRSLTQAGYELLGGKRMGITPQAFSEVSYQRAKAKFDEAWDLAKGAGKDVSDFVREAIRKYGNDMKPYLVRYVSENKLSIKGLPETRESLERIKREARLKPGKKADQPAIRANVVERIQKRASEMESPEELRPLVHKLALGYVREGVTQREPLIDAVHGTLKEIVPDISRSEARDLISGYGDYTPLDKEAAKVTLRGLKGEMQQIGKIEDMQAGKPPQKTGMERREVTDTERGLIKEVNDLKRRGGFTVTDPETQLRTAMDAVKTRLRNEISDLDNAIADRKPLVKGKNALEYDAEAKDLRAQRDAKKAEYDQLFPKEPLTPEQQIERAGKALDRSIAQLEGDLKAGKLYRGRGPKLQSPALEAKRARLDALRQQREELRQLDTAGQDARALAAYKTRTLNQIADIKERLASGDIQAKKRTPREIKHDEESTQLQFELAQAKQDIATARFEDQLANRLLGRKAYDAVRDGLNIQRALRSSFDVSAVFRQGGWLAMAHPIKAIKGTVKMFRALASSESEFAINKEIQDRLAKLGVGDVSRKLFLHDPSNPRLSSMEEAYMSRWSNKIPGIAASERAYTTFLNSIRADVFEGMVKTLVGKGVNKTEAVDLIANYVNVATGRGDLGKAQSVGVGLATAFWSPRLVISRFQLALGEPLWKRLTDRPNAGDLNKARGIIAKEYTKSLAGLGLTLALFSSIPGASVGWNPTSPDFGKVTIGHTRIDFLAGLSQAIVFMARLGQGAVHTVSALAQGKQARIPKYGKNEFDTIARFTRSKLSPGFGLGVDLLTGQNYQGEPVTLSNEFANSLVPMAPIDMYNAIKKEGLMTGAIWGLLSLFGVGVQTYEK